LLTALAQKRREKAAETVRRAKLLRERTERRLDDLLLTCARAEAEAETFAARAARRETIARLTADASDPAELVRLVAVQDAERPAEEVAAVALAVTAGLLTSRSLEDFDRLTEELLAAAPQYVRDEWEQISERPERVGVVLVGVAAQKWLPSVVASVEQLAAADPGEYASLRHSMLDGAVA
jgi:hypothetical protein